MTSPDSGDDRDHDVYSAPLSDSTPPPSDDLYEIFVGPRNAQYYRERFTRFESGGSSASWHWPAFFLTTGWLFYRKMWLWGLLYLLVLPILLQVVAAIVAITVGPGVGGATYFVLWIGLSLVAIPIFAARLYYGHARTKIARESVNNGSDEQLRLAVARAGGTSWVGVLVVFIVGGIFFLGILAAIAIPAYQDYTIRAQVAEGLSLSGGAKAAVTEYYADYQTFPADNPEAGLPGAGEISGTYVESVAIDYGTIVVTYGGNAHLLLTGRSLLFTPEAVDGRVTWVCSSDDIAAQHLPGMCR